MCLCAFIYRCMWRKGGANEIKNPTARCSGEPSCCINKIDKAGGRRRRRGTSILKVNLPGSPDIFLVFFGKIKHKCGAFSHELVPARKCNMSVCLWLELSV